MTARAPITHPDRQSHRAPRPALKGVPFGRLLGVPFARRLTADDPARRAIAGVPDDVRFQTKPEIALQQLRQALADDVPPAVALMDPAYGNDSKLRAGISELGLTYVAGIVPTTVV